MTARCGFMQGACGQPSVTQGEQMQSNNKFYITTPIYYPSGNWHLGHSYTTVICDALARFNRMRGKEVFFLTGTDEHGQKIEGRAAEAGVPVKQFVDGLVDNLKELWSTLDISYDKFIRTTDEYHVKAVQDIFQKLYDKGEIYKSRYEGWYCAPCESFWTDTQSEGGKCPDCGREVTRAQEESYFFRLSKYGDALINYYRENPSFLQPKSRMNEMINNFLKPGLSDLAVSRTSFSWGVPVPFDSKHVVYVWVDALSNYVTALGYGSGDDSLFKKFWPADLHMMAKEIVRFHSIIWPAILMALELPLPKQVYGHGWLLMGGDKLSKSKTENIKTDLVDPFILSGRYGSDAVRYFLLREIPFGADGAYTNEALLSRINADLCNDLGNLVSRTAAMITQNFGGEIPKPIGGDTQEDTELKTLAGSLYTAVETALEALDAPNALAAVFKAVQRANKYIDETAPWQLAKAGDEGKARLSNVLYNLAETIRIASTCLLPFLPKTPALIFQRLGLGDTPANFDSIKSFGAPIWGSRVEKGEPLFPRLDIAKENQELSLIAQALKAGKTAEQAVAEAAQGVQKTDKAKDSGKQKGADKPASAADSAKDEGLITIDDFAKVELKTAHVTACEKVEKSDKLLKLTVQLGGEERTVVSGIAQYYTPEQMVGRHVVLVSNLAPVKLRGVVSQGMILCAEDKDGNLSLVTPEKSMPSGSTVR